MGHRRTILLTNDDSYRAKGFAAAIEVARSFGKVIAVAPAEVQSGKSQAISLNSPLEISCIEKSEDVEIYALTGTPVDCVKFAFDQYFKGTKFDLVLSGINHGTNSAANVLYSGTMGAAIEGSFYGVPSVGLSYLDYAEDADFEASILYGKEIVGKVLESNIEGICLNVNIPMLPYSQIRGIKVCRQQRGLWIEDFKPFQAPDGRTLYNMGGAFHSHEPEAEDTDNWALDHGYVSVVPIQTDLTAYRILESTRKTFQR